MKRQYEQWEASYLVDRISEVVCGGEELRRQQAQEQEQ